MSRSRAARVRRCRPGGVVSHAPRGFCISRCRIRAAPLGRAHAVEEERLCCGGRRFGTHSDALQAEGDERLHQDAGVAAVLALLAATVVRLAGGLRPGHETAQNVGQVRGVLYPRSWGADGPLHRDGSPGGRAPQCDSSSGEARRSTPGMQPTPVGSGTRIRNTSALPLRDVFGRRLVLAISQRSARTSLRSSSGQLTRRAPRRAEARGETR